MISITQNLINSYQNKNLFPVIKQFDEDLKNPKPLKTKKPLFLSNDKKRGSKNKKLAATYSPALAVPSALEGLTSVFGMGTGEPLC